MLKLKIQMVHLTRGVNMSTWEDLDSQELYKEESIFTLRDKLWKENKIKIQGYTYSEWQKEQEQRNK